MANGTTTRNAWALRLFEWVDSRFPLSVLWKEHLSEYYAPRNFNFWYYFGSLSLLVLVLQIVTGIFLTMNYKPDATLAFASVEYIMREVPWGWLIRYLHSTGASAFFICVYLHMFRALLYGSYRRPRELVWLVGVLIFLSLMAEAFFGYLLPWGQMSFWGAQVIVNLFGAIPVVGSDLAEWIRGDFVISDATLNRFFALHVAALPLVLIGLVAVHILALHDEHVGSNNPDGIEIKSNKDPATGIPRDGIPFHPYYTVKDLFGAMVFLLVFSVIVFFAPEMGGYFLEHNNFIPADPLKTPSHIAPVWYFTPYYSVLRATTDELKWVIGIAVVLFMVWALVRRRGSTARMLQLGVGIVMLAAALRAGSEGLGRAPHGRFGGDLRVPAVARPLAGQVDPPQGLDVQARAHPVRDRVHRPWLSRHAGADDNAHPHRPGCHDHLLRVLPADAVVLVDRQDRAAAGEGNVNVKRILAALAVATLAAATSPLPAAEDVKLDDIEPNLTDVASLQSGARTFVNYCLNCHSASLVRYSALRQIDLTDEQIKDNLMFTAAKIGMPMAIAMRPARTRRSGSRRCLRISR